MSVLVCENLNKKHHNSEIRNFSYNFLDNQVYAILEKNEEYQKTLLNLICAKEKPDTGTVWIDGEKLLNNISVNERICYISKSTTFPKNLKIIQIFKIMNDFYPKWDNAYAYELLKHFSINLNAFYGSLNKESESIFLGIIGLASRANITIFENPLCDANIKARYDYFNFLYKHHEIYPRTFIISTKYIDEISYLVDKVLFFDKGRLFAQFTIDEITDSFRYLSGKTEVLKSLISGVKVIGVEERGKTLTVCIRQKLSKDDKRKYQKYLINITEVPIHNIFIYLLNLREIKERQ